MDKQPKFKVSISNILIALCFVFGLCLLCYPTVADLYNSHLQGQVIVEYTQTVEGLSADEIDKVLESAQAFNTKLASINSNVASSESYQSDVLDVNGDDVIGYVVINKINQCIPLYQSSADDSCLSSSAKLLSGTSLPIGGKSTHSVIYAHRGLRHASLFSNLDQLDIGSTFQLVILGTTYTYQVDQIEVVEPDDMTYLAIEEGQDYCTLLTCTPYGINTHRLCVRGVRIADTDVEEIEVFSWNWTKLIFILIVGIVIMLVLALFLSKIVGREIA